MYFEVAVEGLVNCFNSFYEARDEYETLKELGFYEVTLRAVEVISGKEYKFAWNSKSSCFFPI
jgi:hypothetical protein